MVSELAIVGDVHGDAGRLAMALQTLSSRAQRIIFVGDYVNRGPDSRGVLKRLCHAQSLLGERLCLLRGNHEETLLSFLRSGDIGAFAMYGGLATINSYCHNSSGDMVTAFRRAFPPEHVRLIESTHSFYETAGLLVSHCGFNPERPAARDSTVMVMGNHPELFHPKASQLPWLTVCGHYVQRSGIPFASDWLICLDTGCGTIVNAPLTAVLLPQRELVSF